MPSMGVQELMVAGLLAASATGASIVGFFLRDKASQLHPEDAHEDDAPDIISGADFEDGTLDAVR